MITSRKRLSLLLIGALAVSMFGSSYGETGAVETSLLKESPEMFCRKNICVINTVSDPDGTHIHFLDQSFSEIISYTVAKHPKRDKEEFKGYKSRGLWKTEASKMEEPGAKVIRYTKKIYNAKLKIDLKFKGHRETALGQFAEDFFGFGNQKYNGDILIDEYNAKKCLLWYATFKDEEEVFEWLEYMSHKDGKNFSEKKPILFLTLQDDPNLDNLSETCKNFISAKFTLVDYKDSATVAFMSDQQTLLDKLNSDFVGGKTIQLGQSIKQKVFSKIEDYFEKFDTADMIAAGIITVSGIFLASLIKDKILSPIYGKIPTIVDVFNFVAGRVKKGEKEEKVEFTLTTDNGTRLKIVN